MGRYEGCAATAICSSTLSRTMVPAARGLKSLPTKPVDSYKKLKEANSQLLDRLSGLRYCASSCDTQSEVKLDDTNDASDGLSMMAKEIHRDGTAAIVKGQRSNIFQAECKIQDNICKLIIDGGSFANVISSDVVNALSLSTRRLPTPRYMQWMNQSGPLKITHKARVKFSVGKYVDIVDCDIEPLTACHLLLGRPWQFDLDATHSGRSNNYSFVHNGVNHVFKPILESAIKADIFPSVNVKKKVAEISPKPRTTLLQETESDVVTHVSITASNCIEGIPIMDSVVCETQHKVLKIAEVMQDAEDLVDTKPIEFHIPTQETHDAPIMTSTVQEKDSNAADCTYADPCKITDIQFGCFSDRMMQNQDNKAEIGGTPRSIKEASEFISKPRTALIQERENDEPMSSQDILDGLSAKNMRDPSFLKLGAFICDGKYRKNDDLFTATGLLSMINFGDATLLF